MPGEPREGFAVQMRREVGAHRVAALLAHVEGLAPRVEGGYRIDQGARFRRGEEAGEEEVALAVELFALRLRQFHVVSFDDSVDRTHLGASLRKIAFFVMCVKMLP